MSKLNNKILSFFDKTNGFLSKQIFGGKGFVIMLHRVRPESEFSYFEQNRKWEITPNLLEEIIKFFIKKKCKFISINDIDTCREKPFICFTLDDGYYDNLIYAHPIFKRYNIPYTIFITPNFLLKKSYPIDFIIEEYLLLTDVLSISLNGKEELLPNKSFADKANNFNKLYITFRGYNNPRQLQGAIRSVLNNSSIDNLPQRIEFISEKQLIELSNDKLVNIGIHTMSHFVLSQLSDKELYDEVYDSMCFIHTKTGIKPTSIAYPYGSIIAINEKTVILCKRLGIKQGFTSSPGNVFSKTNKLLIPRYLVDMNFDIVKLNHLINGVKHFSINNFSRKSKAEQIYDNPLTK